MVNAERILETERVGAVLDVEKMRERQTDNDVDELPARSARGMREHQTGNESLIFGAGQPIDQSYNSSG